MASTNARRAETGRHATSHCGHAPTKHPLRQGDTAHCSSIQTSTHHTVPVGHIWKFDLEGHENT